MLRQHTGRTEPYTWLDTCAGLAAEAGVGKITKPFAGALEAAFGVWDPEAPPVIVDGVRVSAWTARSPSARWPSG